MLSRTIISAAVSATVLILVTAGAGRCALPASPPKINPDEISGQEATQPEIPECVITGRLLCSEYGSRFNDLLELVFVSGDERYSAGVSDTDGTFAMLVPCGRTYVLRVEFDGKGYGVGDIVVPVASAGTLYRMEVVHTGSYLELVRDVRNEIIEDDISFKLTPAAITAP